MKNKKLIVGLTVVASISYFGSDLEVKKPPQVQNVTTIVLKAEKEPLKPLVRETRAPSNTKIKTSYVPKFEGSPHPSLPKGFNFSDEVAAVKKADYKPELGRLVEDKAGYIFYRSNNKTQVSNRVVIDTRNKKLHLISSVIKLEDVDEKQRNDILSSGVEEHYYNEDLKIMYVQTSQEDLLKTHDELKELKLDPKLEVIRGFHRPL